LLEHSTTHHRSKCLNPATARQERENGGGAFLQLRSLRCISGAAVLSITTLSIMILSIMTLSIMTLSIMTLSIMTLSKTTLSKTMKKIDTCHAECSLLTVILSAIMLIVVMLIDVAPFIDVLIPVLR
jgi:hypothetical protein